MPIYSKIEINDYHSKLHINLLHIQIQCEFIATQKSQTKIIINHTFMLEASIS